MGDQGTYDAARNAWFTLWKRKSPAEQFEMAAEYAGEFGWAIGTTQFWTIIKGTVNGLWTAGADVLTVAIETVASSRATWDKLEAFFNRNRVEHGG